MKKKFEPSEQTKIEIEQSIDRFSEELFNIIKDADCTEILVNLQVNNRKSATSSISLRKSKVFEFAVESVWK